MEETGIGEKEIKEKEMEGTPAKKTEVSRKGAASVFFWIGLFCELLVSPSGFAFGSYHEPQIIVAGMVFFCCSILCSMKLKRDWWIFALAAAYGLLCYHFQHSALVLRLALILLAGREQDRRRTVQFFFLGTLAILVLVFGLALAGDGGHPMTSYDWYRHGGETRFNLGFYHPNGFAFFWMRTFVMGLYLYAEKMKPWMFGAAAAVGVVPFLLVESKMGLAAFVLILGSALLLRFAKEEKTERIFYLAGNVLMGAELLLIYTLGIVPYPQHTMGSEDNLWDIMNTVTTGRLDHARTAFLTTPLTAFGARDVEQATEIGFVNAIFHEGVVFIILYTVLIFWLFRRLYREKDRMGMLLVLAFTFYSLAEAYLPYFNKNGVWLMLIAGLPVLSGNETGLKGHEQ